LTIELPPWLGPLATFLCLGAAIWKGGFEERFIGLSCLLALAVTIGFRDYSWPKVQWGGFIADTALLVVLVVVALRAAKYWPLAGASIQLLAVITHVAKLLDVGMGQWAYITAGVIWSYALMVALSIGVWNHARAGRAPARAQARDTGSQRVPLRDSVGSPH
jgi:hypothetical protein